MHSCRRRLVALCVLVGLSGGGSCSVLAQGAPKGTVQARFSDAQDLAVAPTGRLYVVDAGRDVVCILARDGTKKATLGGTGTRAGEFDQPAGVDPTNGQSLWVADAGNGRVQRFSDEGRYLEAVPVGRSFREGQERRVFDDGRDGATVQGGGRPVAVASSSGGETFVIDERNGVVLKWNEQRRPERIVGEGGRGGRLQGPVALALDGPRRLYVADRAQQAILAFDSFGSFVRRLSLPPLPDVQALTMHRGRLWIVCKERVFVWAPGTGDVVEHAVDLPAPLVDADRQGDDVFLLTAQHLYRRASW